MRESVVGDEEKKIKLPFFRSALSSSTRASSPFFLSPLLSRSLPLSLSLSLFDQVNESSRPHDAEKERES